MTRHFLFALLLAAPPISLMAQAPLAPAPQAQAQPQPQPENAFKYLQQASAAFVPYKDQSPPPEQARRIVEDNAAVFPLLERAVRLPLRFEHVALTVAEPRPEFEILGSVRNNARLLALRSSVQAQAGDVDGALDSGLLAVALGLKLQEDGPLISAMSGYAVENIGLAALEKIAPRLSAAQAARAARRLGELGAGRTPFGIVLDHERDVSRYHLRQIFAPPLPPPLDETTPEQLVEDALQAAALDDGLVSRHFALTRDLDSEWREDGEELPETPFDPNLDRRVWVEAWRKSERPIKFRVLLLHTRAQARLALMQAALAVRAHRLQHGAPPASLQVLVPGILPALPADPFEIGAPLLFKSDEKGITIYSVGPDGFDDGGRAVPDKRLELDSVGDILAPPELLKP